MRIPDCHPRRRHSGRGLCGACSTAHAEAGTLEQFPRTNHRSSELAERAEKLRAELESAGPYSNEPYSWPAIARRLGVAPKTLEKARQRARQYADREARS